MKKKDKFKMKVSESSLHLLKSKQSRDLHHRLLPAETD